ncbi:MAG: hypothetical protein ABI114_01675 [Rhodanobacter sp.]
MNDGVRFGWVSESRREALRALVFDAVLEWSSEWWIHHVATDVCVRSIEHRSFVGKGSTSYISTSESGLLAIFMEGNRTGGLGRHLAGADGGDDAGWAERIGQEALEDLSMRVFRLAGAVQFPRLHHATLSPGLDRADLGTCAMAVSLGQLALSLLIDRQLVDRTVAPKAAKAMSLTTRRSALDDVPLRINAVMNFGSVKLTQLSDLRAGEVLIGDCGLEEALQICVEGRGAIANAYLRRSGTKRAVMLGGIHPQEEHES